MRAQKAQHRQKQMRQNLLGHNLLNMSLYNAAQQQQQMQQRAAALALHQSHQAAYPGYLDHPHGAYAGVEYMPMPQQGYELDEHGAMLMDPRERPAYGYTHPGHEAQYGPGGYGQDQPDEVYHLPNNGYDAPAYDVGRGIEYYGGAVGPEGYGDGYSTMDPAGYDMGYDIQDPYRLPPLISPTSHMAHSSNMSTSALPGGSGSLHAQLEDEEPRVGPRMRDWDMQQQTPSGHVVFNDGLFDGELGMGMSLGKDDGLGDFNEAMQQASEMW
jgi:hypothetical protein